MRDPFEESLRHLLCGDAADPADGQRLDHGQRLDRVLRTAKRQIGVGELFRLPAHWLEALLVGLNAGSSRPMSATRRLSPRRLAGDE